MVNWKEIVLSGLTSKSGEEFEIVVGAPENQDGAYSSHLVIPGVLDRLIHGENALSTLISALRIVEAQVYEPSKALISVTTLTNNDYPDLRIMIRINA